MKEAGERQVESPPIPLDKKSRISMDQPSYLPEILDLILRKIDMPTDVLNFSTVCKLWHSVLMEYMYTHHSIIPVFHFLPKRCPLPMLLVPLADGPEMHNLYSINEQRTYNGLHIPEINNKWICGSSRGWLVTVDIIDRQMHLLNPIEKTQILLPHMSTFRMPINPKYQDEMKDYWSVRKANVFFGASSKVEDCVIVAIVSSLGRICFCRIGDDKWTDVFNSPVWVRDFIMNNDQLFAMNHSGTMLSTDIRKQKECSLIACRIDFSFSNCYLVKSPNALLLVLRISEAHKYSKTIGFRVFRLIKGRSTHSRLYNLEESGYVIDRSDGTHYWEEIESIGDWLIFVGYNSSLCLDSRLYPSCKKDCIYFADNEADYNIRRFCLGRHNIRHDIVAYHLQEKKIEYFTGLNNLANHHALWFSPSM